MFVSFSILDEAGTTNTNERNGVENGDDLVEEVVGGIPDTSGEAPESAPPPAVDEDEESDDEEVNVIVRTGPLASHNASGPAGAKGVATPYQAKAASAVPVPPSKQTKTIDLSAPGNIQVCTLLILISFF